ncbi:MAG: hypothetical protein M3Q34_01585 [bacterium]|nr:hypothetical protein [bacterium]
MDPLNLNNNVYTDRTLFPPSADPKFINVEYYFNKIYQFFRRTFGGNDGGSGSLNGINNGGGDVGGASTGADLASNHFDIFAGFLTDLLYLFLLIFITIIAYVIVRMFELRKKEHEHIHHEIHEYAHRHKEMEEKKAQKESGSGRPKNERWENVLKHLYSESSADWKLSIIDADEMLFALMTDMGFKGDGLGEKLKSVDRDEFRSLSAAWEVHTIRNRIAHEGTSYQLSQREAKRVIALYEQIFLEFGYV